MYCADSKLTSRKRQILPGRVRSMPRAANLRMQEQGGKGVENEEENSGIRQLLGVKVRVAHFISYILNIVVRGHCSQCRKISADDMRGAGVNNRVASNRQTNGLSACSLPSP